MYGLTGKVLSEHIYTPDIYIYMCIILKRGKEFDINMVISSFSIQFLIDRES